MCVYIFHLPKHFFRLHDQVLVQDVWPQRQTGVHLGWGAKKVRWTDGKGWEENEPLAFTFIKLVNPLGP